MHTKYKQLKKVSILFGMLILLFNSTAWGISQIALIITEFLFFFYLVHWLDPGRTQRTHMRLIFFSLFITGTVLGRLISNTILRIMSTTSTVFAAMLFLYSIKNIIVFDRKFLFRFFSSAIYLPFAYIDDFFTRESLTKNELIKRQKIVNGIILSSLTVILIFIPLYAGGDYIFKSWIEIIVGWILKNTLSFLTAIIFCWIPAMLIYSYMKGLDLNSLPNNPPENILKKIDNDKMFFNLFSVKTFMTGIMTLNCLFVISQLIYFFDPDKNYVEINSPRHMIAIFAAILLNVLFLIFLTFIIKEKRINENSISLSSFNIYYALSIVMVWITFCWRYIVSVFHFGLKGVWPLWGLAMLLLLVFISWNVVGVLWDYQKFIKIMCYGTAIIFLVFNICIPEFWIGKINVMIFNYKYNNNMLENISNDNTDISTVVIQSTDLDMGYLRTLNEWAIPAFLTLKDVPNYYEKSGKTIGNIAEEEILSILEKDLTEAEKVSIEGQSQTEKLKNTVNILSGKAEYHFPGTKRIILNMLKKSYAS